MVREVGFEPTNPYGTGASGLRVQDPFSHHRVSLTWLGNTSRHRQRTPANSQARSRKDTSKRQGVNWLSPARPSNTATQECREDTETQGGNATDGAASSATDGR